MSCTVLYQKAEHYTGENMTQYHIMAPSTEAGWRARAIFTWMRIVRASEKFGKPGDAATRGARMSNTGFTSSMRVARQHLSQRRSANPTRTWREQTEISRETGATSGAAAVILKRRRAAACMHDDVPAAKKRVTADGEQSTQHTWERRVDSQLIFSTNALRLYVDRITFWRWWPRTGDG